MIVKMLNHQYIARTTINDNIYCAFRHQFSNSKINIYIVKLILEELGKDESLIEFVTDRLGHDRRYAIAPDKIKADLGWYPETMFKDGIRKTIAWFFENEEWMKNVTSGDYQKYYEEMYK